MDVKERNKKVKKILANEFGYKNVNVIGGRGTAYGWCEITIKTPDPCPDKQNVNPCSSYCNDGICKGNQKFLNGNGWGNSVRQLKCSGLRERAEELIKDVEFYSYTMDDGYGTQNKEVLIHIKFV